MSKTMSWPATRSLLVITALSASLTFLSIWNGETKETDFAHLDTRAKRDQPLQMSAAADICYSVVEIKLIKRKSGRTQQAEPVSREFHFYGGSPSFLQLIQLV